MQTHNPFPLLASETALKSVLDDLEADLGPDHVYMLRVTGTYHRVMGYACEARLAGLPLEDPDPLLVTEDDLATLEDCVRVADEKRQRALSTGVARGQLRRAGDRRSLRASSDDEASVQMCRASRRQP